MTDLADVAWLVGLIALGVIAARAARAARRGPDALVDRTRVLAVSAFAAALGVAAAWVWGIAPADDGMARLATAPRGAARARVFVRAVSIPLRAGRTTIGYAPDGGVRLPASYDLDEATRGRDLVDLAADGPIGVSLAPHAQPQPTTTRVLLGAIDRDHGAAPLDTDDAAALAARLLDHRACGAPTGAIALHGPGAAIAVLCRDTTPVAALVIERDLGAAGVRATPLVWRDARFVPHQVDVAGGEVLEIGRAADIAPGLTAWEVPAPAGQARLLVPPDDVLAPCRAWNERAAIFARAAAAPASDPDAIACVLPYAPPFVLEVRRLVPDLPGVAARSLWAAGLFATVALFALLALASRRRGELTQARFARALAAAWVGVALAAIAVARLLWAHRIDMMRDFEPVGVRVLGNQVAIVLAAAALAAAAARDGARATGRALIAWAIVVVGGGWALRGDADAALATRGLVAQAALSLALGLAGVWVAPAARAIARMRARLDALAPSAVNAAIGPSAPLIVVAAAAALAAAVAPHAVVLKLALAWTAIVVAYHALHAARAGTPRTRLVTAAGTALAVGALARLDAGVTAAIVIPGLAAALIALGHDARFGAADGARLDAFERDHAPVVLAHAALVGAAAVAVGAWALTTTRADLPIALTRGALGGALLFGALLAAIAVVTWRRRGPRASAPWLALAAACGGLWLARDLAIARATDGNGTAAGRVAQILDPGAALLRDPARLVAGMTATRETVIDQASAWRGQGYFGAQVVDPGVRLSIENDYAPVLVLREGGVLGVLRALALLVAIVAGLWWISGERFAHASAAQRSRRVVVVTLGGLVLYQPLAALGLVPLTGIAWPGLGLDSPTDLWALVAIALYVGLGAAPELAPERHDRSLRGTRAFRRTRIATAAAAALALAAAVIVVGRGALHAATRAAPLDADDRATPGFEPLARAADYAQHLVCPVDSGALAPADLVGQPDDATTRRFHADLRAAFGRARPVAADELARFAKDPAHACTGDRGGWRFARAHDVDGDTCDATWRFGWPTVHVTVTAPRDVAPTARCAIDLSSDVLTALRPRTRTAPDAGRIRLVSEPMGAAARDRGELVAGHLVVRLRPGAGPVEIGAADAGLFAGDTIHLAAGAQLAIDGAGRAILHVDDHADVALLEHAASGGWTLVAARGDVALDRAAIVVVGKDATRRVWSFRTARAWTGDADATVAPLLADDVGAIAGRRRRHYVYGGDLPELGWVNPFRARQSLGLDGWVHVAIAEKAAAPTWQDGNAAHAWCGTLDAPAATAIDPRVCAASPDDGVLECRVTVQPELALQLRHLTEIISADLPAWAGKGDAPTRASFVLLRGDTGAIVAAADVVPGRASSAYAPSTPALEQALIALREARDEASAEKSDWNEPIAAGSALKPLIARAAELAAPASVASLFLSATDSDPPPPLDPAQHATTCRARRGKSVRPILGHCPPTPLVDRAESFDFHDYLARSSNWYQAVLGVAGLAFPDGTLATPDEPQVDLASRPVDAWSTPVLVSRGGEVVVGEHGVVRGSLARAPLWQRFTALVGRPLCADDAATCLRESDRRDLCALRALPIAAPTADLRHLVALGPDRFELSEDRTSATIPLRDYFQFLRGSGLHPLGSLAQLADAFARVVYDPSTGDRFRLAASWFPTDAAGTTPDWDCARTDAPVESTRGAGGGLCGVVQRGGTAFAGMKAVLADPRVVVYGAKTGTIDALADVSEHRAACEAWNDAHTILGRPARADAQPYWLPCGKSAADDSLFVVAFGVRTAHGVVPFTLALDFQRTGKGVSAALARHYIDAVAAYFSEPSASASSSTPAPTTPSPPTTRSPFAQPPPARP